MSRYIEQHRGRFGVEPICPTLGVSASAYYQRKTGQPSRRRLGDERLSGRIRELHRANYYAYGSRPDVDRTQAGGLAGRALHRAAADARPRHPGRQAPRKPWRTTRPYPAARRRPDLVEPEVTARGPNQPLVADITYLRCWDGVVLFAFVIDAWSRRVVGWQLVSPHAHHAVLDALRMALHQRGLGADVELVHHSDRGSQARLKRCSQASARVGDAYPVSAKAGTAHYLESR